MLLESLADKKGQFKLPCNEVEEDYLATSAEPSPPRDRNLPSDFHLREMKFVFDIKNISNKSFHIRTLITTFYGISEVLIGANDGLIVGPKGSYAFEEIHNAGLDQKKSLELKTIVIISEVEGNETSALLFDFRVISQ